MWIAKPLVKSVRVSATLMLALFGLLIAFFLAWFARNLIDEPLTPAAAALLTPRPDPLQVSDNLFVAFAGFSAPSGQSMMAVGETRLEGYDRARGRRVIDPAAAETPDGSRGAALTFKGNMEAWGWLTSSIWSTARTHRAEIGALLDANHELYERYLALHAMRGYFASPPPDGFTAYSYIPPAVQELFLAEVSTRLQTGTPSQREAALADLQQDVGMWKAVLDGYGDVLSKVIAALSLHADYLLLGDMVTDPAFDPASFGARWETLLTPFDLQDWKIGAVYPWEMRRSAPLLEAVARADVPLLAPGAPPAPWWRRVDEKLSAQFFKLNATENREAQRIERLRALADGNPATFSERRDLYRVWERRHFPVVSRASWYNPMGRALLAIEPLDDDYPARVFDVAAFQRLVFLAYQIKLRCIGANDIATFMKQHPQWATHPIDAQPFHFDPARGELSVLPVGENRQNVRFSVGPVGSSHCPRS